MGVVLSSGNADFRVPMTLNPSSSVANLCGPGSFASGKYSSFWIVVQKVAKLVRGKIAGSHETFLSSIGQRPGIDSQSIPASSFYGDSYD